MPLTNAERQKRFRERLRAGATAASGLTAERCAARDAVMAEPLYPVPPVDRRAQMPRFKGWERYEWSEAPAPLIDHFGMRAAWEGWQAEKGAMKAHQDHVYAYGEGEAGRIIAECGDAAIQILSEGGRMALFRAYGAYPTLGRKKRNRVT